MTASRIATLLAFVLMLSVIVSGCGSAPTASPDAEPDPTQAESSEAEDTLTAPSEQAKGQIVIWAKHDLSETDDGSPGLFFKQRIDAFEAATGIEVVYEQIAWDQLATKLALAVQSGGDVPDIVEVGSQHIPSLLSAGALMQLDELLANEAWVADLNSNDQVACTREGKRCCVANLVRSSLTYYRADEFPNGFPATSDELLAAGEALKAEDAFVTSFFAGKSYGAIELNWGQFIYSNGGRIFDDEGKPVWANGTTVQVLEFGRELLANGYIPEDIITGDFATAEAPWIDGNSASFRGGTWSFQFVPGLSEDFAGGQVMVAGGIGFNGNSPTVFLNSENWIVPVGANNPAGAVVWISQFMQPEILSEWSQVQFGIPTLGAAVAQGGFDDAFYASVSQIIAEQGKFIEQSPYYEASLDALAAAIQEIMLDPNLDSMPRLQQAQDEILNKYWN